MSLIQCAFLFFLSTNLSSSHFIGHSYYLSISFLCKTEYQHFHVLTYLDMDILLRFAEVDNIRTSFICYICMYFIVYSCVMLTHKCCYIYNLNKLLLID